MSKHLPVLFVILLSSSLGYFVYEHFQMKAVIEEYNEMESEYLSLQKIGREGLLQEMFNDIHDEIENEGKLTNKGLLDTLRYLRAGMDTVFEQETVSDSLIDFWEWELEKIYNANLPDHIERDSLSFAGSVKEYQLVVNRKWALQSQFHTVLYLLNGRLGVGCRWGLHKTFLEIQEKEQKGDSTVFRLGISHNEREKGLVTYWHYPNTEWKVTKGRIENEAYNVRCIIDNEQLKKGVQLSCKVRKITGGYELYKKTIRRINGLIDIQDDYNY
ncbi:MAG: hypothetical protein AAF927_19745 [Bacteroidota bacterium]